MTKKPFPQPPTAHPELSSLFAAWGASAQHHHWSCASTPQEIGAAEAIIGRQLPDILKALYHASDGLWLLQGNLQVHPLNPGFGDLGLVNGSDFLRQAQWPVPDELLIFGGNGSESYYGLWLPRTPKASVASPIVALSENFSESERLAVVRTDLLRFLNVQTAYYLMVMGTDPEALDILGVPSPIRSGNPNDGTLTALYHWADPTVPDPKPDVYERGYSAEELRARYG